MTPAPSPASAAAFTAGQRRMLTVLLIPLFLALMSVSVVNVALPAIERDLGASPADLQWVLSGYTLTFGVVLVAAGRAGDLWGRRPLFLAGISLYVLGSLVSGLAPNPVWLTIGRLLTGVGAGVFNPQVIGFIQTHFTGRVRGRAYGLFGMVVGLGVAAGPLLGGVLIGTLGPAWGWRGTFLMNAPVGLLAILMGALWLAPDTRARGAAASARAGLAALDPVGAVLLGAASVSLMVPFIVPGTGWLLAAAAVLGAAWWLWERRVKATEARTGVAPMVDPALFRRASFTIGAAETTLFLATMPAVFAVTAVFLQQGLEFTALASGLATLPGAAVQAGLSPWAGARVQRHGPRLVALGGVVGLVSLVLLWQTVERSAAEQWSLWTVAGALAVMAVSQALILTTAQVLMMDDVQGHEAGAAGGVAQTAQRTGTALGLSVVMGAFYGTLGSAEAAASGTPSAVAHAHAASVALLLVGVSWAVTTAIALADLVRRRRRDRAAGVSAGTGRAADAR